MAEQLIAVMCLMLTLSAALKLVVSKQAAQILATLTSVSERERDLGQGRVLVHSHNR